MSVMMLSHRVLSWGSLGIYFFAFVLFFVGYVGNNWYVTPVGNHVYPPDDPVAPLNFGLFYLCFRGDCKYDLRQDYQIVKLLPPELGITTAYQKFRTACMAIVTVAAGMLLLNLGAYFMFLAGFVFSSIVGFVAAGLQILAGVITLIGIIMFGVKFRGNTDSIPFGWSMWLVVVAMLIFIINGALLIPHTIVVLVQQNKKRSASRGRPLTTSPW